MSTEIPFVRRYLIAGLEATPIVMARLLEGIQAGEADFRPDPERFTIRQALAHLAEWDAIFLGRMERICSEDVPVLPNMDEGQLAIDHNYDQADVADELEKLRDRRARLVAFLNERSAGDWNRLGNRPEIGMLSLEMLATFVPLHDAYHLRQVVEWRAAFAKR